jgi:archaemetzincin
MSTIRLVSIGHVEENVLKRLESRLKAVFPYPCALGPGVELPPKAFNVERSQFLATLLLDEMQSEIPPDAEKILGITDVDLYVPDLNFVFGLADVDGQAALISICRLRQEFYGLTCNGELFVSRMVKEALHELGHAFGLIHCQDPQCAMFFSNSLIDTDRKREQFCTTCLKQLQRSE